MPVSAIDLERSFELVRSHAAGMREGLFGPASMTWRIDREAAVFLGAGRALLLQLAHPWVAAAVGDQSRVFADPVGRFHRTFGVTFTMVFGSLEQALAVARKLHQRHEAVTGVLPQSAGPFAAGSSYLANEVAALRWVHATLVETALVAYELVLPKLSQSEGERYWSEARLYAALFGIPPDSLPSDWTSFIAYNEAMAASDVLTVSQAARDIAQQIFSGQVTGLRPPFWYRALTAQLLPERLREAFELPYGEAERKSAARALGWMRRVYPSLPQRLRTVGPYQEAAGRLQGRDRPSFATRCLNRLWIGQPGMAGRALPQAGQGACERSSPH